MRSKKIHNTEIVQLKKCLKFYRLEENNRKT